MDVMNPSSDRLIADTGPEQNVANHSKSHSMPHYRSVFISDLHLGTPGCQAEALLEFLKHTECDHLYLVGDIIDGWQLKRRWFWPQTHNDVIQKKIGRAHV